MTGEDPEQECLDEIKEAEKIEPEVGNDDSEKDAESTYMVPPRRESTVYILDEDPDKKYKKIVDIFKKQPVRSAVIRFFKPKATDEVDGGINEEISVETMKFAIQCLHRTENPFHSFMNTIRTMDGNKEKLFEELATIPTENEGFISREAFRMYTAKKERERTHRSWWCWCDGDPEKQDPKGKLIDYFHGIARAQKVTANPISILFPIFGIFLILFHIKASNELKDKLNFNV